MSLGPKTALPIRNANELGLCCERWELSNRRLRGLKMTGYTTHNSVTPQRRRDDQLLLDALGILHRFGLEQTGWRGWLRRWYYSDEPLRHDAANLVRRAGYLEPGQNTPS